MKTVIAYESKEHQSVLKLVKAIEGKFDVALIDVTQTRSANLAEYDLIGFASETEDDALYRDISSFAANWMPRDKKIFFLYTYPVSSKQNYCEEIEGTAHFKNCEVVGKYGCQGLDGAGGFRLFGGKGKTHPNEDEINAAVKFFAEISGQKLPKPEEKPDTLKDKKEEHKMDKPKTESSKPESKDIAKPETKDK